MVSHLRDGRVHWGAVDWLDESPALHELSTRPQMERTLQTVGFL